MGDMDLDTLPTLGLPMEDTLPILDPSMEDTLPILDLDFLVTMAKERLMLNQRLKLMLMLCTLPMDMDLATLPILGLPMEDLSMVDTLPIQDPSMEDTLPILDLSMEDIPVTMANQRLMLMLFTLHMDMDLDAMPTLGLHMEDTLPIQ